MSSEIAIKVDNLSKCYNIYSNPRDRLKQFIIPKFQRLLNLPERGFYREFWALKDVSLDIKKGETIGIIGRNGSGKSTLLQLISGTLNPSNGSIYTQGRVAALLELGSGFNPEFSGHENIYLNGTILGLSKQEIDAKYNEILSFADIGEFINQPVKTYSSGMVVRLAFAVIAHVDADILIVDEALAVGDAFFTQKCMRFLRNFMLNGTVLFVSHDTAAVRGLCNRAIWLSAGKVVDSGSPKDVCERYLEASYEAQQGSGNLPSNRINFSKINPPPGVDQRQSLINSSTLRNDLEIFQFNPDVASFGKLGAEILDVSLLNTSLEPLSWVVGGENIILRIKARSLESLYSPILGFFVKDRLGQVLFGDNTYLTYAEAPLSCNSDQILVANFTFQMPRMPSGDYSVCVAIATGTQLDHIQHHWIHDAIIFRSDSTSVSSGLIGIPISHIEINIV